MTMGEQVEADSQSLTECSLGRMGIYTLYLVCGVSAEGQKSVEN